MSLRVACGAGKRSSPRPAPSTAARGGPATLSRTHDVLIRPGLSSACADVPDGKRPCGGWRCLTKGSPNGTAAASGEVRNASVQLAARRAPGLDEQRVLGSRVALAFDARAEGGAVRGPLRSYLRIASQTTGRARCAPVRCRRRRGSAMHGKGSVCGQLCKEGYTPGPEPVRASLRTPYKTRPANQSHSVPPAHQSTPYAVLAGNTPAKCRIPTTTAPRPTTPNITAAFKALRATGDRSRTTALSKYPIAIRRHSPLPWTTRSSGRCAGRRGASHGYSVQPLRHHWSMAAWARAWLGLGGGGVWYLNVSCAWSASRLPARSADRPPGGAGDWVAGPVGCLWPGAFCRATPISPRAPGALRTVLG
jgi:hypothetical protein